MKVNLRKIIKLVMQKRLTKSDVKLHGEEYSCGYTDAINDILTSLHRINQQKQ